MLFSNLNRNLFFNRLTSEQFDLLVIGGGITGCGIALDAALKGMKVALVEKNDFAFGTSSRSTKLIHGGLRYLKQLELKLVRDVGTERAVVHRNARHLVIPEKMLLPIVQAGTLGELSTSAALLVYDLLAGVKRSEWRTMLNKHETLKAEPLLAGENLLGGGMYFEYRTDDSRLTIEIAKRAAEQGALLLNYIQAEDFIYENGKIFGAKLTDKHTGKSCTIRASTVVNACGPWVDLLRKKDQSLKGKRLQLTKGVHIVFPHSKLPIQQAVYFDVSDGRMIFAIPRSGITYVGTTDTVYNQDIDQPVCTKEDVEYLLAATNKMFSGVHLSMTDVESSWAGLRPLIHEDGKSPSELSRKDEVIVSENGLISIAGGKLTGYRLMAQKTVAIVQQQLGKNFNNTSTKGVQLSGGKFDSEEEFQREKGRMTDYAKTLGINQNLAEEWFYRYGSNMPLLLQNAERLLTGNPASDIVQLAEWQYAIEHEMVLHPTDFLMRRSGKLFFQHRASHQLIPELSKFIAHHLHLNEHQKNLMQTETMAAYQNSVTFN